MNSLFLHNANLILPGEILHNGSLLIQDGNISGIYRKGDLSATEADTDIIDCDQKWIFPGIIDLHTDALEHEIAPRPFADFDIEIALRELERKMSGCGYHTVYHSMYLGYTSPRGGISTPRETLFEKIYEASRQQTLIRNKIHLRFEITGIDAFELCLKLMERGYIDLLSLMDHTPGQGQYGKEHFVRHMLDKGKTEAEAIVLLEEYRKTPRLSDEQLDKLISTAAQMNIPVASHDDDTPEKVEKMYKLGVSICEFPINMDTAETAHKKGMTVIGGAANVLRGGSLSDNLNVAEGIVSGFVDCLCSDYYPPAMLHSIFKLEQSYSLPFEDTSKLLGLKPAEAVGLSSHTGSIETGKKADLMVVQIINQLPLVTHNIVGGKIVSTHTISPTSIISTN